MESFQCSIQKLSQWHYQTKSALAEARPFLSDLVEWLARRGVNCLDHERTDEPSDTRLILEFYTLVQVVNVKPYLSERLEVRD